MTPATLKRCSDIKGGGGVVALPRERITAVVRYPYKYTRFKYVCTNKLFYVVYRVILNRSIGLTEFFISAKFVLHFLQLFINTSVIIVRCVFRSIFSQLPFHRPPCLTICPVPSISMMVPMYTIYHLFVGDITYPANVCNITFLI